MAQAIPLPDKPFLGTGAGKERLRLFSEIPRDEKRLIFTALLIACQRKPLS